jgi:hypothetical protein
MKDLRADLESLANHRLSTWRSEDDEESQKQAVVGACNTRKNDEGNEEPGKRDRQGAGVVSGEESVRGKEPIRPPRIAHMRRPLSEVHKTPRRPCSEVDEVSDDEED